MLGVCLWLAATAAGASPVFVPGDRFTLAWTHSIEKQRWEEDYAVVEGLAVDPSRGAARAADPAGSAVAARGPRLLALAARVRGSAAGMEPAPDAVLRDGWYHYRPATAFHDTLRLSRSTYTADFEWCVDGRCRPLGAMLPSDGGSTLLRPCRQD